MKYSFLTGVKGSMVVEQVVYSPHLQGPDPDPELELLCVWSFSACSPYVHIGSLWVLWFAHTSQKHACRWIGCAKLRLGVNRSQHGVLP